MINQLKEVMCIPSPECNVVSQAFQPPNRIERKVYLHASTFKVFFELN